MYGSKLTLLASSLLLVGAVAQAEVDVLTVGRCGASWKDSVGQDQAPGRIAFSLKCEKNAIMRSAIKKHAKGTLRHGDAATVTTGYPTYGTFDAAIDDWANPKDYIAPVSESGRCEDIPPGYQIAFFCASGCYAPDQGVLFGNGYENLVDAKRKGLKSIMSLSEESTMDALNLKESKVAELTGDKGAWKKGETQPLRYFKMASGGELTVTLNHPLLTRDGKIRPASEFADGDFLVKADGTLDPIVSSLVKDVETKVYNVSVDSSNEREQIIVAQGYLNGSLYYQNETVREVNRQLLRSTVASNFIH